MSKQTKPTEAKRITAAEIIRLLLTRERGERSSVTLARNAKGNVQVEVQVRTGDTGDVLTVLDAEKRATEIYERLAARYPMAEEGTP